MPQLPTHWMSAQMPQCSTWQRGDCQRGCHMQPRASWPSAQMPQLRHWWLPWRDMDAAWAVAGALRWQPRHERNTFNIVLRRLPRWCPPVSPFTAPATLSTQWFLWARRIGGPTGMEGRLMAGPLSDGFASTVGTQAALT
eukprot:8495974-Alexandrium_andersonii.AAC.1